jgi:hypothetical protein
MEKELRSIKNLAKDQNSAWAVQGDQKIQKKILQFIEEATDSFFLIMTPDLSASSRDMQAVVDKIIEKKKSSDSINVKVALKVNPENSDQKSLINRLFHSDVDIFNWGSGGVFPFGLVLTDRAYLQTFLNSTTPKPRYEFGIFMENCSQEQLAGFHHLCLWVFTNLCQKVIFQKKKKPESETNQNEHTNGDDI